VLRFVPERVRGLEIINNEADMKVGFDLPFEPRMTERFAAWLAATLIVHDALNERYAPQGLRFIAASDNANQQLIRSRFDGRRSIMTMASDVPDDLLKLPVYAFYELLPFLTGRRATAGRRAAGQLPPDVYCLAAVDHDQIGVLFTSYRDRSSPAEAGGGGVAISYLIEDLPWDRINVVAFRIDRTHGNVYGLANSAASAVQDQRGSALIRELRMNQELVAAAPIQRGLAVVGGAFWTSVELDPFATVLLWITPSRAGTPPNPAWISAERHGQNGVVRWEPSAAMDFYGYEVFRTRPDGTAQDGIAPAPLRSALWVDMAPVSGEYVYGVRTVNASGGRSEIVQAAPVRI
jgi:hypothetical protein